MTEETKIEEASSQILELEEQCRKLKKSATLERIAYLCLIGALAVSLVLVSVLAGTAYPKGSEQSKLEAMKQLILERFIGEADAKAMEDAAAQAMVSSLGDRWSYYLTAEAYTAHLENQNNAYVGVGVTIRQREGVGFDVVEVTAGGPAEGAGILPGDVITAIEGQSAAQLTAEEARGLIRGQVGTQVEIVVDRQGSSLTFSVPRRSIQTAVATGAMLEGNIGLVRIVNFDSRCADETKAAIEDLLAQGAEKLIFDVRNNPGGYVSELVELADYLLPEGPVFRSVEYTGQEEVYTSDAKCVDVPMAVLVNGESYSAAEFFAAVLSEYDVAVVVGQPTCGKGYFQRTYAFADGSAIGLSVGKYFTPGGVSLAEAGGLVPDVAVEVDADTAALIAQGTLPAEEDPQIQAAIQALK